MDITHSFGNILPRLETCLEDYKTFQSGNSHLSVLNGRLKGCVENVSWLACVIDPDNESHRAILGCCLKILTSISIPQMTYHMENLAIKRETLFLMASTTHSCIALLPKELILKILAFKARSTQESPSELDILPQAIFQLQHIQHDIDSALELANIQWLKWKERSTSQLNSWVDAAGTALTLTTIGRLGKRLPPITAPTASYIFALGKMYNPFPCHTSRYIDKQFVDNPARIQDLISLMSGEAVQGAKETYFKENGKANYIFDQYGFCIKAPEAFTLDYFRQKEYLLNGVDYCNSPKLTPIDFSRELYALCGKAGSHSLMLLCTQSLFAFPLIHYMQDTIRQHAHKIKDDPPSPMPSNVHGFGNRFKIDIDPASNSINLQGKALFRIHTSNDSSYKGFFVYKIQLSLPHNILTNTPDLIPQHLKSIEQISTLVENNLPEAAELFCKF